MQYSRREVMCGMSTVSIHGPISRVPLSTTEDKPISSSQTIPSSHPESHEDGACTSAGGLEIGEKIKEIRVVHGCIPGMLGRDWELILFSVVCLAAGGQRGRERHVKVSKGDTVDTDLERGRQREVLGVYG
jgi:hypothetical protein